MARMIEQQDYSGSPYPEFSEHTPVQNSNPVYNAPTPVVPGYTNEVVEQITGVDTGYSDNSIGDISFDSIGKKAFDLSAYNIKAGGTFVTDSSLLYQGVKKSNWFADIIQALEDAAKKVVDVVMPEKKDDAVD